METLKPVDKQLLMVDWHIEKVFVCIAIYD